MAQVCGTCGTEVLTTRLLLSSGKWVGIECGCMREAAIKSTTQHYGDLTLEHIHDERGKPIRVTSIRQLREAEKRYGFKHHVANSDSQNFNNPPSHRPTTVSHHYKRKFARG